MKKILRDTGATKKATIDYFELMRTSEPIESYGLDEFRKRMEAERTKKVRKSAGKI